MVAPLDFLTPPAHARYRSFRPLVKGGFFVALLMEEHTVGESTIPASVVTTEDGKKIYLPGVLPDE